MKKHPNLRNEKRAREAKKPKSRPGVSLSLWPERETRLLKYLIRHFQDEENINGFLHEKGFFPGKIKEQILSRRAGLNKLGMIYPSDSEEDEEFETLITGKRNPAPLDEHEV